MRKRANATRILYYIGSLFSIEITAFYVVVSFFADLQDQRIADKLFKLLALALKLITKLSVRQL